MVKELLDGIPQALPTSLTFAQCWISDPIQPPLVFHQVKKVDEAVGFQSRAFMNRDLELLI